MKTDSFKYYFKLSEINDYIKLKRLFEYVLEKEIIIKEIDEKSFTVDVFEENIPKIIQALIKEKYSIFEVSKERKTLEDAFVAKTGGHKID